VIDGIRTEYDVVGDGPPLLMFSPGGFDAVMAKWTTQGVYRETNFLAQLAQRFTCVLFDRRESGRSGGRVERVTWAHYAAQGRGLLEHLGIERAHALGGCMGCPPAAALAAAHPAVVERLVLYWPVGGAAYRLRGQGRFREHLDFVGEHGLEAVVERARSEGGTFGKDPIVGPWGSVLGIDREFAERYGALDAGEYRAVVGDMRDALLDRDEAPGGDPDVLGTIAAPTLVVPGQDESHATSAARYLHERIPESRYWDAPVAEQTEATAPGRVIEFLEEKA
jgi:pimeloyl-ACP methyl ester carboxylesterase